MSKNTPNVIIEIEDIDELPRTEQLPERLQEAAALHAELGHQWFDDLSRKAPVLRSDGYQLPTLLLFFFALFTGEFRPSIKYVCQVLTRPKNRLLAACGGFLTFPSQASVSRFLRSVRQERLEENMVWMLVFSHRKARALMRHAGCACRDTFGAPWQLFDLDPTSTVVRQRALPENKELPPPIRRLEKLAGPGYVGRKRGDALFRRVVLQHTGSSLWLGSWLRYAGTETRQTFAAAIETVVKCCRFAGFELVHAILRIDGEGGNVPTMTACNQAGISYLMRGIHYSILERPEIRQQLLAGQWYKVDDSGSGPRRLALDLGQVKLSAGTTTLDDQGQPYSPIASRVVVARFEASKKSSSGVFIEDAVYELFVTNLPDDAWPASEVVTLYYHRATEENRFGREDKELSLDTVYSQRPQGQSLVTLVGLLVWNLRVLLGFRAIEDQIDDGVPDAISARQARAASALIHKPDQPAQTESALANDDGLPAKSTDVARELTKLRQIFLAQIKRTCSGFNERGFSWDKDHGLRCQEDHLLEFSWVRQMGKRHYMTTRAPQGICGDCASRYLCARSTAPQFRKERVLPIESPQAARALRDLLSQYQQLETQALIAERRRSAPTPRQKTPLSTQPIEPDHIPYTPARPGPYKMMLPRLNPAALKQRFASGVVALSILVRPGKQPPAPAGNPYLYQSAADRARQRRTWTQRLSYNRRTVPAQIHVYRAPDAAIFFETA